MATKKNLTTPKKTTARKPRKDVGFWQEIWDRQTAWTVRHKFWQRLGLGLIALILLAVGFMYSIAQWYIRSNKNEPVVIGTTFIPDYARHFDLDPKETFGAMINDLGIKNFRLVSYWDVIEPTPGTYNFSELDWQFKMAEEANVKISLAMGMRQPRWPECHEPAWALKMPDNTWYQPLYAYMEAVVNRYKNSPALESYQLENEFFLKAFGMCTNFDRDRLVSEYKLIKGLDPDRKLIVSMSNNAIGTPLGEPTPDEWAISIYKRVWDKNITLRYFEYPIPAWYYAFRAGFTKITRGHDSFIHELQTEPWTPENSGGTKESTLEEQDKSMSAQMLTDRIQYGRVTGMKAMYLWGSEWWYWRLKVHNDPSLWNAAKEKIQENNARTEKIQEKKELVIINKDGLDYNAKSN